MDQTKAEKPKKLMELYELGKDVHGQDLRDAIDQMDRDYEFAQVSDWLKQIKTEEELEEVARKVREVLGKEFVLAREECDETDNMSSSSSSG